MIRFQINDDSYEIETWLEIWEESYCLLIRTNSAITRGFLICKPQGRAGHRHNIGLYSIWMHAHHSKRNTIIGQRYSWKNKNCIDVQTANIQVIQTQTQATQAAVATQIPDATHLILGNKNGMNGCPALTPRARRPRPRPQARQGPGPPRTAGRLWRPRSGT